MKKLLALLLTVIMLISLTACSTAQHVESVTENDESDVQTEPETSTEDPYNDTSVFNIETDQTCRHNFVTSVVVSLDGDDENVGISIGSDIKDLTDHGWKFNSDETLKYNAHAFNVNCDYNGQSMLVSSY